MLLWRQAFPLPCYTWSVLHISSAWHLCYEDLLWVIVLWINTLQFKEEWRFQIGLRNLFSSQVFQLVRLAQSAFAVVNADIALLLHFFLVICLLWCVCTAGVWVPFVLTCPVSVSSYVPVSGFILQDHNPQFSLQCLLCPSWNLCV